MVCDTKLFKEWKKETTSLRMVLLLLRGVISLSYLGQSKSISFIMCKLLLCFIYKILQIQTMYTSIFMQYRSVHRKEIL